MRSSTLAPGLLAWALLIGCAAPAEAAEDSGGGYARLEGHGGPVKGVAVSADGRYALTASFDYSVGAMMPSRTLSPRMSTTMTSISSPIMIDSSRFRDRTNICLASPVATSGLKSARTPTARSSPAGPRP